MCHPHPGFDPFAYVLPGPVAAEVRRDTLLSILADVAYSVIVLTAPFGFGKTTTLAQHARHTRRQSVWVTLCPDDADPIHFAASIIHSVHLGQLKASFSDWKQALSDHRCTVSGAHAFAHDLADLPPLDLILDNLDELGVEASGWLAAVLTHLPGQHRVLLAGHGVANLPVATLATRPDVLFLHAADLAFTPDEVQRYLSARGQPSSKDACAALEGWPVGLALAGAPLVQWQLGDLIYDLLRRFPAVTRTALPELAVVPVWSVPLAHEAGCRLPADWLDDAVRVGLPLTPLGHGHHRPHPALLDTLEQQLRHATDRHAELHRAAGRRAERADDWVRALRHFERAGDHEEVVRLLRRVGASGARRGQFQLVRELLEAVTQVPLPPDLLALLGYSLIETGEPARGEELLGRLAADGANQGWALAGWCLLANRRGQHQVQLSLAEAGLAQADRTSLHWFFHIHQALALLNLDRGAAGAEAAERALRLAEVDGHAGRQAEALTVAQFACMTQGRWNEREALLHKAIALHDRLDQPILALEARADLADQYRAQGRLNDALDLLDSVLSASASTGAGAVLVLALEVRADVHFARSEWTKASSTYREALRCAADLDVRVLAGRLWIKLADTLLHQGLLEEAWRAHAQAVRASEPRPAWLTPFLDLFRGQASLAAGALSEAAGYFERVATGSLERTHRPRALAYLAEIARRSGVDSSGQLAVLEHSLHDLGHPTVLHADARPLAGLLNLHPALIGAAPERVDRTYTALPLRLRMGTLGRFSLTLEGKPIQVRLSKARELLVFLALHGATSRDGLMTALWEGSTQERHLNYFRVAVRSARGALAAQANADFDPLPYEQGEYQLSERLSWEVDVQLLAQAGETMSVVELQHALALYRGPFLTRTDAEWAERVRAQAQADAVRLALTLGDRLEAASPREAQIAYGRATELDPWSEAGHLGLVRAHRALGNTAEAVRAQVSYARALTEVQGD